MSEMLVARMIVVAAAKRGRRLAGHQRMDGTPRAVLEGYLWHAFGEWADDYAFLLDHAEVILPALDQLLNREKPCTPQGTPGA